MSDILKNNWFKAAAVIAAAAFLYASVLMKLGSDWWTDENYSHGLLVPFVIALIIWREWDGLKKADSGPSAWLGGIVIAVAMFFLLAGTLGAELFTQRVSLALMLAGIVIDFFGVKILRLLAVPFALLLLAIPIPQIIFNKIALPLQTYASQMAVWGIRIFEVPTVRNGNVIDILPRGSTQTISLEVVEACSGIRSLMTLVTLALILGYFTRRDEEGKFGNFSSSDLLRAIVLMLSAVPIAVLTNAARVTATGVLTYYYGKQATESTWHEVSGWLVYLVALALLVSVNVLLKKVFSQRSLRSDSAGSALDKASTQRAESSRGERGVLGAVALVVVLLVSGIGINWFASRGEADVQRRSLVELPAVLGDWKQKGGDIRFGAATEAVLRTTDYTMREYMVDGRTANVYVGYYATQRTGATYHSPQNCLPGAGWVMRDPQLVEIEMADGRSFKANMYIIENGIYRDVMIYWYQGRGHAEASEYRDKFNTVWDSVTRRRSDGAMVRVMTDVGSDQPASIAAATDLAARLAEKLSPFIPD